MDFVVIIEFLDADGKVLNYHYYQGLPPMINLPIHLAKDQKVVKIRLRWFKEIEQ